MIAPISSCWIFIVFMYACGLNYKTAPIALRERFALSADQSGQMLISLIRQAPIVSCVILNTCNRVEFYIESLDCLDVPRLLLDAFGFDDYLYKEHVYVLQNKAMIEHLIRVSSGLDSMVLGEPQIFGQIKSSYMQAEKLGCISGCFKSLFPAAFSASKHIRTNTDLSKCPVSIAYIAVKMLRAAFTDLSKCNVMLLGCGHTIELITTHLSKYEVAQLTVAGRNLENATVLAKSVSGRAVSINNIADHMASTDIIISATSSSEPLINQSMVMTAMSERHDRPLWIADLAVPRDIAMEVSSIDGVTLLNIDDMQNISTKNMSHRQEAALQAESMIKMHAANYERNMLVARNADVIGGYRKSINDICSLELDKALDMLTKGYNPRDVLHQFAHGFTNKILHEPTKKLREFAATRDSSEMLVIEEFFEL